MDFTCAPSTSVGLSQLYNLAPGPSTQGDQPLPTKPHGTHEVPPDQQTPGLDWLPQMGHQATCSPHLAAQELLCGVLLGRASQLPKPGTWLSA